jgi:hypothetical protein
MMKKRGQVTIFIIIAIIIVALAALLFTFYSPLRETFISDVTNPKAFVQSCLEEDVENAVNELSLRGGELEPESYYMYQGNKIRYLCYTNEYYQTCIVQEPMLKNSIEDEIKNAISSRAEECFDNLEQSYRDQGYQVTLNRGEMSVELLPERIVVTFDSTFTITKEASETYEEFSVVLNNNLYELISITNSIINFESSLGDVDVTAYMDYYSDLKVEKITQSEGTKIFVLTNRDDNKKFQFATRSIAWPPGYLNNE